MTDVLVVDDKIRDAESFARLIEAETGLVTAWTGDPAEASEIVRAGTVKVAVLDQSLDGTDTTGTQLFRLLRELDPDLRAVLFTGAYSTPDVIEAFDLGIMTVVDKDQIAELPERVRSAHAEYLADLAARAAGAPSAHVFVKRRFSVRGRTVRYEVLGLKPLARGDGLDVVLEATYETFLKLDAGQEERIAIEDSVSHEVVIEQESLTKLRLESGADIKALARIQSSVEQAARQRSEQRSVASSTRRREKTFSLLSDMQQREVPKVRARHFERAPVYRRERALLRVSCDCCGVSRIEPLSVLVPTGRFRTRHTDYLSDNTQMVVDTG